MHEKTLLYSALAATAIAAGFGVYKAREPSQVTISPVSLVDSSRVAQAEVPIRLTSSDGTGLKLASLKAAAAIEDPLALTELHLVFENPEDRILEGTFRITLPQGASLSRFAMKVGETWQEGEVVEKQKARQAYEDFLHRKQDPALMEQGGGNEFSARVFPIPARGKKEIILAYSEVLEAGAAYTLPLRGLPQLENLDVDVHAAGARPGSDNRADTSFGLHQSHFTPADDFVVAAQKLPRSAGLRSGDLAIARVVPFAASRPEPVAGAVVLVDTSASRGLGLAEQARLVARVIGKLSRDASVTVACFDQEIAPIFEGKAGDFGEKQTAAIIARGALGASDFEQAIGWAAEEAKRNKLKRVVFVGDGVATAGEIDAQKLKTKVEALRPSGVERMDAVAVGGIRDDGFLRTIVRGVLDKDGVVLDASLGADAIVRRLGEATSSGVPVKVDGATWSWPRTLDGLQAGDEIMVYAQIDAAKPFKVDVGGQPFSPDLRTVDRPLVERAWAKAKIDSLVAAPVDDPVKTKSDIVALSTRHRVLSPHTAMLVLETDWDYQRFAIDRTANIDILSVQDGRVAVVQGGRARTDQKPVDFRKRELAAKTGAKGGDSPSKRSGAPALDAPAPGAAAAAPRDEEERSAASNQEGKNGLTEEADSLRRPAAPGAVREKNDLGGAPAAPIDDLVDRDGVKEAPLARGPHASDPLSAAASAAPVPIPAPSPVMVPKPEAQAPPRHVTRDPAPPPPPATATATARPVPFDGYLDNSNARGRRPTARPGPAQATAPQTATGNVRAGSLVVEHGIGEDEAQRVFRGALPALRACYTQSLHTTPSLRGSLELAVAIDSRGDVKSVDAPSSPPSEALKSCAIATVRSLHFAAPGSGDARVRATFDFVPDQGTGEPLPDVNGGVATNRPQASPYEGRFLTVMEKLVRGEKDAALDEANRWRADQPGDVMALVALGEALEARGDLRTAARAYGSILELFSFRADSRRFAGERLERLGDPAALRLAADTYGKAAEQRPDHPASHRLYAFALLKRGEYEKAFEALKVGATRQYPAGRFMGVDRILREDLGLVAAAWAHAQPGRTEEIRGKLHAAGGEVENQPSLRFVLVWETDANDVDFHIYDGRGGHAYYSQRDLPSGGSLYADVTTGYGPECFTIRGAKERRAYPYTLQAHYYSRGPMGYGMGKLQVVEHDGHGGLTFDDRPFVVMKDRAYVDLGNVSATKSSPTASLK